MNISINNISNVFDEHLNIENNQRIIFSGKFGLGKTFFIKNHLNNNPSHNAVCISPVNYVVSSNEDIFELIPFHFSSIEQNISVPSRLSD